jgi:hypothetical protein
MENKKELKIKQLKERLSLLETKLLELRDEIKKTQNNLVYELNRIKKEKEIDNIYD